MLIAVFSGFANHVRQQFSLCTTVKILQMKSEAHGCCCFAGYLRFLLTGGDVNRGIFSEFNLSMKKIYILYGAI